MIDFREKLRINEENIKEINEFLLLEDNPLINGLLLTIEKYGGVDEINYKAMESRKLENLLDRLRLKNSTYVKDLEWLIEQRDNGSFVSIPDYRRKIMGNKVNSMNFDESFAVTLEISACNFFPFFMEEVKKAIAQQDVMPSRYIRVRYMKEQVEDNDLLAFAAAMQIIGATYVETLDTKGTMLGSEGQPINVHLGGPDTITGYFGGVGMPNEYSLKWIDELLYYYTEYGIKQVLNVNMGTILLGFWLHKLGIDIEFKISVYFGVDNPYASFWTLMAAKLFSRDDGKTPLVGLNPSNSVNNETIELSAYIRKAFGFEDKVRIEHHIVETYKSIVRQPYDRLEELIEIADHVKNLSAKHEGAGPVIDEKREHPSDILEYFLPKKDINEQGLMPKLLINYLDKHDSVNRTARALTKKGLTFIAAKNLHKNI